MSPSKKRPGESRGISPPSKRTRPPEELTAATSPRGPAHPGISRKISTSSSARPPAGAPSGPSAMNGGRTSEMSSDRVNAIRNPNTGGLSPLNPLRSPMSSNGEVGLPRSGTSTPVQAAPTVPSMVPATPAATTEHQQQRLWANKTVSGLDSSMLRDMKISQLAQPKQPTPIHLPHNAEMTALKIQFEALRRQCQSLQGTAVSKQPGDGESSNESNLTALVNEQVAIAVRNQFTETFKKEVAEIVKKEVEENTRDIKSSLKSDLKILDELQLLQRNNIEELKRDAKNLQDLVEKVDAAYQETKSRLSEQDKEILKAKSVAKQVSTCQGDIARLTNSKSRLDERITKSEGSLGKRITNAEISDRRLTNLENSTFEELRNMEKFIEATKNDAGELKTMNNNIEKLEQRINTVEENVDATGVDEIWKRISDIETEATTMKSNLEKLQRSKTVQGNAKATGVDETSINSVQVTDNAHSLQKQIEDLLAAHKGLENHVETTLPGTLMQLLGDSLNAMLEAHVRPVKTKANALEEKVTTMKEEITAKTDALEEKAITMKEEITAKADALEEKVTTFNQVNTSRANALEGELSAVKTESSAMKTQLDTVQNDQGQATQLFNNKLVSIDQEFQALKDAVLAKFKEMTERRDIDLAAFRNLEDRYQNISSELIFQKMTHWFQEAYPDAPALMADMKVLKGKVQKHEQHLRKVQTDYDSLKGSIEKVNCAEQKLDENAKLIKESREALKQEHSTSFQALSERLATTEANDLLAMADDIKEAMGTVDHLEARFGRLLAIIRKINENSQNPIKNLDFNFNPRAD